jgi:GNAT superfamily N-acetyltransferase
MINDLILKRLDKEDYIADVTEKFKRHGIKKEEGYFERCYTENISKERATVLAYYKGVLAGCCHLIEKSNYPFFSEECIPEINDLNVFPEYRRKGIADKIIDELEKIASESSDTVGIGVGLYKDYGSAQRLYCRKGYIPDGNGIQYNQKEVEPGTHAFVDDDLNLYFTKKLK